MNELFGRRDDHESAILPGSKGIDKTMDEKETEVKNTGSSFRRRLVGAALTAGLVLTSCAKEQPTVQPSPQPSVVESGGENTSNTLPNIDGDFLPANVVRPQFQSEIVGTYTLSGDVHPQLDGSVFIDVVVPAEVILRDSSGEEKVYSIPNSIRSLTTVDGKKTLIEKIVKCPYDPNKALIHFANSSNFYELNLSTNEWLPVVIEKNRYIDGEFKSYFNDIQLITKPNGDHVIYCTDQGTGGLYKFENGQAISLDPKYGFISRVHQMGNGLIITSYGHHHQNSNRLLIWNDLEDAPLQEINIDKGEVTTHLQSTKDFLIVSHLGDDEGIQPMVSVYNISPNNVNTISEPLYLNYAIPGKILTIGAYDEVMHLITTKRSFNAPEKLTVFEIPLTQEFFKKEASVKPLPESLLYNTNNASLYSPKSDHQFSLSYKSMIKTFTRK